MYKAWCDFFSFFFFKLTILEKNPVILQESKTVILKLLNYSYDLIQCTVIISDASNSWIAFDASIISM